MIDAIADANSIQWMKKLSNKAQVAHGRIQGVPVMLCKPMTFMNVSGESVMPLMKKHGLELSQVGSCTMFFNKSRQKLANKEQRHRLFNQVVSCTM